MGLFQLKNGSVFRLCGIKAVSEIKNNFAGNTAGVNFFSQYYEIYYHEKLITVEIPGEFREDQGIDPQTEMYYDERLFLIDEWASSLGENIIKYKDTATCSE